jgi:hypothetical protein
MFSRSMPVGSGVAVWRVAGGGFAGVTNSHSDVAGDVAGNVGSRDSTFVVYLRINGIAGRTFNARDIIRCPGKH